jgi:ribonuclease P protein component
MARFDKRVRLLSPQEFVTAFKQGTRLQGRLLEMVVSDGKGRPRLGLAISSKSLPLATRRNRFKRLVRESFRHNQHALPIVDVVVMARRAAASQGHAAVRDELMLLWKRVTDRCRKS